MSETIAADSMDALIQSIGERPLFDGKQAGVFKLGKKPQVCDIVLKGGVTSGIVYPYAILRLAQRFRLAGIGGTSAGAMAAALAAAAEYARLTQPNGHLSFARFERQCLQLPQLLTKLFQPEDKHAAVFAFATAMLRAKDEALEVALKPGEKPNRQNRAANDRQRRRAVLSVISSRAWTLTASVAGGSFLGGVVGAAGIIPGLMKGGGTLAHLGLAFIAGVIGLASAGLMLTCLFQAAVRTSRGPLWKYIIYVCVAVAVSWGGLLWGPFFIVLPAFLSGGMGLIATGLFWAVQLAKNLKNSDFGMCTGMRVEGSIVPGVTEWLHAAIQDVAGRPLDRDPLTFGEVEGAGLASGGSRLALRMITTNLSLRRPYALPEIGGDLGKLGWSPDEWSRLFPQSVLEHLIENTQALPFGDDLRQLPAGGDLPVIVGARMSLSFPILFRGVPVHQLIEEKGKPLRKGDRMLLIDGGLSSNLPLHFFDSLGPPTHPTFAFNLEEEDRAVLDDERISLHKPEEDPPVLPPKQPKNLLGYLSGLLGAAKDWQDNLQSIMPGQFDRIVGIRLGRGEGGLNLTMPPHRSKLLMQLGYRAGNEVARHFNLGAHRIRRALAAYQEIERVAEVFGAGWSKAKLAKALQRATVPADAASKWPENKKEVIKRFGQLADWSATLTPPMRHKYVIAPRGALRITPNLSGDI